MFQPVRSTNHGHPAICGCQRCSTEHSQQSTNARSHLAPLLQQEVLEQLLLRLEATFREMTRDLIGAYREFMKREDANAVLAHAFRALDELAHNLTGNDKAPPASNGVFGEGE